MEEADLFVIELPNGEILNATSGQWDVFVPFGDVVTGPDASGTSNGFAGGSTITSETISPGSGTDFAVFVASNNGSSTPSGWTGVAGGFNTLQLDSVAPLSATTDNPGSYPWASVIATFQTSGPVTKEQSIDFGSGSLTSLTGTITETFSADINAGDTIFVYISGLGTDPYSGSVSVSDNNGNEYHAIAAFNTTGEETGQAWLFYALNCNAGSTSVTLVLPETIGDGNAAGYSYSGIFGGVPITTFFATKYGRWSRGTITSEASFEMTANTMALTCAPQPATAFPGNPVGVLNAALNGLFDAAQVTVYTAYFPLGQYGFLAGGVTTPPGAFVLSETAEAAVEFGSTVSTTAVDTGNASINFICLAVTTYDTEPSEITVSDTIGGVASGNTWIIVPQSPSISGEGGTPMFYYCYNPAVGNNHVFTVVCTGNGCPNVSMMAFTGMPLGGPEQDESYCGVGGNYGPIQCVNNTSGNGYQAPIRAGDLVIAASGQGDLGEDSIAITADSNLIVVGTAQSYGVAGISAGYLFANLPAATCTGEVTITGATPQSAVVSVDAAAIGDFVAPQACTGTVILAAPTGSSTSAQIYVGDTTGWYVGQVVYTGESGWVTDVGENLDGAFGNVTAVGSDNITVLFIAAAAFTGTFTGNSGSVYQVVRCFGFSGGCAGMNSGAGSQVLAVGAGTVTIQCGDVTNGTYGDQTNGLVGFPINPYWYWNGQLSNESGAGMVIFPGPVPSIGTGSVETKFKGTITRIVDIDRVHVEFECGDPMYLLNMKVPRRLMQPNCPWSVTDENCTLNAGGVDINGFDMTQAFTLSSGTQYVLFPATPFVQPEGYFSQGVVTCTAGNNAGLSQTVKLHANGELQLLNPWLLPVSVGDTFSVLVGCDHTPTTCTAKFGNLINFGGTPFVPPSDSAV